MENEMVFGENIHKPNTVALRIESLLKEGKTSEQVQKLFISEGHSIVNLNGLIGIKTGNVVLYHPNL